MDLDLTGRHALVCGASQGIGRAAAHELAGLGADVTVLARSAQALQSVVEALPRRGAQRHHALEADLSQREALREAVATRVAQAPVHILVNNTGGPPGGPALAADEAAFVEAFAQHLLAGHALVKAVVPGMRAAGWGRIVNVVSTSVYEPIAGLGVSNTVRGAVASWAKTLSRELGPHGITVNNVLPGYTDTARIEQILRDRTAATGKSREQVIAAMLASVPVGRFARPEEPGGVIAFLCSPAAAYVNGVSLAVDGGRMQSI
ncbi:SDR family oxidoreductase [Luteimonas kalidii]|uniref:SDR family oxidoreductase n=1 Tax=Luteimonas kalidii TaxID=3042025 RepID=A0ABT6JSW6_9GAMM|nr:SDR family oxidoreductase [Luteimonas kalidii]MDH5833770.1 SDR family oxidoreductase [Luteimonas kalidii]